MNIVPYKIILLYDKDCMQCKYILELLKKDAIDNIELIEQKDRSFDYYKKYSITKLPTIVVLLGNKLIKMREINSKKDLEYILDNYN